MLAAAIGVALLNVSVFAFDDSENLNVPQPKTVKVEQPRISRDRIDQIILASEKAKPASFPLEDYRQTSIRKNGLSAKAKVGIGIGIAAAVIAIVAIAVTRTEIHPFPR